MNDRDSPPQAPTIPEPTPRECEKLCVQMREAIGGLDSLFHFNKEWPNETPTHRAIFLRARDAIDAYDRLEYELRPPASEGDQPHKCASVQEAEEKGCEICLSRIPYGEGYEGQE